MNSLLFVGDKLSTGEIDAKDWVTGTDVCVCPFKCNSCFLRSSFSLINEIVFFVVSTEFFIFATDLFSS